MSVIEIYQELTSVANFGIADEPPQGRRVRPNFVMPESAWVPLMVDPRKGLFPADDLGFHASISWGNCSVGYSCHSPTCSR
jgi:hypothetical protein